MPSASDRTFSATYDSTTKAISIGACALLLVVVAAVHSMIAGCLAALLLAGAYAYSPRGYTVAERFIVVNRLIGNVRIPLDGAREVRIAASEDLRGCIRLFGSGGMFGYYGLFRTSKLGKSTWYVTDRSHIVIVLTSAKTVLFSPDDVERFLAAIRASGVAPAASSVPPELDALGSYRGGPPIGALIGALIGIAALAVAAFGILYSPGPPSYTLTPQSLTIHDRFYPVTVAADGVDVEHIRIIDLSVDTDWQPTVRTNGFANAHYRAGWFRVASGLTVRMYRADGTRLVLLPPKGNSAPVLLEARDPEGFAAEVRREWSTVSRNHAYN